MDLEKTDHRPIPPSNHDAIMLLADQLQSSIQTNGDLPPTDVLRAQLKTLAQLHALMAKEAGRYATKHGYDTQRLSLSLRAQNQFCRTLLVLDHLENRELEKQKLSNELQKPLLDD